MCEQTEYGTKSEASKPSEPSVRKAASHARDSSQARGQSKNNAFALFSLNPTFTLNTTALERTYIEKQREFHPDRFAGKSEAEKLKATQASMALNEAYNTLKKPLSRAEHLLSLNGYEVNTDTSTIKPDHTLLTEMLEHREALEEASTPEALKSWVKTTEADHKQTLQTLATLFKEQEWQQAASHTIRLRYLEKAIEEAKLQKKKIQLPITNHQ